MVRRKCIIIFCLILSFQKSYSQNHFDSTLYFKSFSDFNNINWGNYIDTSHKFIFSSESHAVSCDYDLSFSIIRYLLKTNSVNLIIEYPFSFGIITNEYLKTGEDSLLKYICYSEEQKNFWHKFFALSKTLPQGNRIKVWGIDFEFGNSGHGRSDAFPVALKILMQKTGNIPPLLISKSLELFNNNRNDLARMRAIKNTLYDSLERKDIINYWGKHYKTYKQLISRYDHLKSRRNGNMFQNFISLYNDSLFISHQSRFFAQFGYVHVLTTFKHSLAYLLNHANNSPVKSSVFTLYNQYINCYSNLPMDHHLLIQNGGPIEKKRNKDILLKIANEDSSGIKIINMEAFNKKFPSIAKEGMNLLILLSNFNGIHLNTDRNENQK